MASAGTEGVVSAGSSVAEGAAIGTMIAPGVGTAVGAAVGAIAGAFGFGSSKKKRKARRLAKQSRQIQNLILRKNMVVEFVQASAVAAVNAQASGAGTQKTSSTLGVLSSLQTQALSNLKVNTELFNRNEKITKLQEQAEKMSAIQSGIMSAVNAVGSAMAPFGGQGGGVADPAGTMRVPSGTIDTSRTMDYRPPQSAFGGRGNA